MKTVWQATTRAELIERAARVRRDSPALWGKMTAADMLAHVTDSLKMALGDLPVASRSRILRFPPLRHAIIHWLPFPKGAPTAPELRARTADDWNGELAQIGALLARFAAKTPNDRWVEHAAFGAISGTDWGVLVYRHLDHHLRQFGA
jgi:hypothetical protein